MPINFKQLLVIALGLVFGIFIAVTLSPKAKASGCYSEAKVSGVTTETVNGRTFLASVPDGYNSARRGRLVIQFHGYGMNPTWMRQLAGSLEKFADNETVFFYPASSGPAWNQNIGSPDIRFFDDMIRFASERYCIGKVYVTGYSNGAFFVNWLATQRRSYISALASVAGGGSYWQSIPAIVIHGYQDQFVAFSQGNATRENYAYRNKCSGLWTDITRECQTALGCRQGEVLWCPWNGNHDWPWFASKQIMNLFNRY